MDLPKISVIIPSFNKAKYIDQTLKSIFDQKYNNLEVIVQDGGSTDGTLETIKKYARKYPKNVKWESGKDKGQLAAINKGFRNSNGDILTYINADDLYERGAFEEVAKHYLLNPEVLWLAGRGGVIDLNGGKIAVFATRYKNFLLRLNSYPLILMTNYFMQPSVFIARSAYKKYGPFTGTGDFVMEYNLWLKLGRVQMPQVVNKDLSMFRIGPENITSLQTTRILKEDEKIAKKYTGNWLILALHKIHNLARKAIGIAL
ncbi:MAG TPA: glycosyltransferase family 2 protein [Patescibacteria group bacterium]|nr:glycosyltransferase family 2 protein [Patescibacteria group bacterium]